MAKTVAKRVSVDAQELWNAFKGDAAWRASYDKFRAKGLSFTRAVEEASRKSTGGSPATKTASGKARRVKRAGAKPVIIGGGVGGVTPEEEAESRRYGRGQGKVKRESKMGKATAKGDNSRIGQVAIKRAWAKARASAGDAKWATMTKEEKVSATLRRVGPMTGEEAIGAVRALGSRVLTLSGSNDEVTKMINDWATGQGVKSPKTELKIGAKGKAEGKTGKQTARAAGKGAEAPAGPEKPKPEPGMGKKAKRIIRRRNRLDEILRKGETEDQTRRELAQKPTPDPDAVVGESENERKNRLAKTREEDEALKSKTMVKIENEDGTTRWVRKEPPLPKGVRRRVVNLQVIQQRKPGKNKLGDTIEILTLGERKFNLYMKGDTVYVAKDEKEGFGWKKVPLSDYQEQILESQSPYTREELKIRKQRKMTLPSKPAKSEFPVKMERVTTAGKALNTEYIVESASQAFIDANRKISEKNKIALGKGTPSDKLAPRYKVADFVDAAYPNLGKAERSQLISGIRRKFRGERKVRKAERAKKTGGVTVLRPETVEEGRARLTAKERRIAKRKAEPLEKVKLESKAEGRRRARRVKTVGQTLSAVMDPSKSTPSAEEMEPAPKAAKRKFVAPKPGSELEAEIAKLRESLSPTEKSTLRKIKETSRVGFTKDQVKKLAATGTLGKVTPKVRKIAKAGGYLGIVATALQFLEEPKQRKK